MKFYGSEIIQKGALSATLRPHKWEQINKQILKSCWSARKAFTFQSHGYGAEPFLYTYVACGKEWQPPHTYTLLFRYMPHEIAQKLMAVVHFLTNTLPQLELYVKIPNKKYIAEDPKEVHRMEKTFYDAVFTYLRDLKQDVRCEKEHAMDLSADLPCLSFRLDTERPHHYIAFVSG